MGYRKLTPATKNGTRLEQLKALAGILARKIDSPGERDNVAQLAKQYRETTKEIEMIEGMAVSDDEVGDVLAEREAAGKPGAVR